MPARVSRLSWRSVRHVGFCLEHLWAHRRGRARNDESGYRAARRRAACRSVARGARTHANLWFKRVQRAEIAATRQTVRDVAVDCGFDDGSAAQDAALAIAYSSAVTANLAMSLCVNHPAGPCGWLERWGTETVVNEVSSP